MTGDQGPVTRHRDFFAANASRYDDSRPPLLSDSPLATLVDTAALTPQGLILDIATGTGRVAIPFARAGYRVIGVDRAEEMLHVLRNKAPDAAVIAVAAEGHSLPFPDARFDAVLIARLLYLAPDWREILADAIRVLHSSGRLLHEWAGGTPEEPWVQIRERLRMLLERAGIDEPFHPGARSEEHAKLIRPEATTTRTAELQPVVEFLDPIFQVAAGAIDLLVDAARRLPQVRDDEARFVARRPTGQPDDFGFDDDAALGRPGARGVAGLGIDVRRLPAGLAVGPRLDHRRLGQGRQARVFGHGDDGLEPRLAVQEVQDRGCGEGAVQADEEPRRGEGDPQQSLQPPQHPDGARLAATLPGRRSVAQRYCSTSLSRSRTRATADSTSCHSAR